MLVAFLPIAALLTLARGVTTVVMIRRAAVSGRRAAFATTLDNEVGVLLWALCAGLGLAAMVAASSFLQRWLRRAERLCGVVLIGLGVRLALEQR